MNQITLNINTTMLPLALNRVLVPGKRSTVQHTDTCKTMMSDTCVLLKTSQGIKHAMYIEFLFKWYDMNILLPT